MSFGELFSHLSYIFLRRKLKNLTKKSKKMKKMFMLVVLLLSISGWISAQGTGEIRGRVIDSETKTTIPGANVYVKIGNSIIGAQTDKNGNFILKPLVPGTYNVEFTFVGYGKGTLEKVYVYADGIAKVGDISLDPGVDVTGVEIWANPVIGLDVVPKMMPLEIKNMADKTNLKKIIGSMSADIQTTEDGEMYFRGARDDDFVYYVDGIKLNGDNVKITTGSIGSIQVYTGGVPARYGDFTGGCVVIETQSYYNWLNSRN